MNIIDLGFAKLILLLGILIFAKKFPTWIGNLIGIKSEDGLGGLSLAKKLGGAALVGGALTKATDTAKQKGKNFAANRVRDTAARIGGMKEAAKENRANRKTMTEDEYEKNKQSLWKQGKAAAKRVRADNYGADAQGFLKDISSGYMGGRKILDPNANTISERLKDKSEEKANAYNLKIGNDPATLQAKIKEAKKMITAQQMRAGKKVEIDPVTGKRDAIKSWQGYDEFQKAIGGNAYTEDDVLKRDIMNNFVQTQKDTSGAEYKKFSYGNITVDSRNFTGPNAASDFENAIKAQVSALSADALKSYKNKFATPGQADIKAFVDKNIETQTSNLKTNVELRFENDKKIAEYESKISEIKTKNSTGFATDPSYQSFSNLIGQLKAQNTALNGSNLEIMKGLQAAEMTYTSDPSKCISAKLLPDGNYETILGKFKKNASGTFDYEPKDNTPNCEKEDPTTHVKYNDITKFGFVDPTLVSEIMTSISSKASKSNKDAEQAHENVSTSSEKK